MAISKNAVAGGVAALGGTGAVAGVVIANQNKETIEEKLKNDLLTTSDDFNSEWTQKITELNGINEDSKLTNGLKAIKDSSGDKKDLLQNWCNDKSKEQSSNEELLNLVKKWCVFTIKQKMGEEWSFPANEPKDEVDIKHLIKELKASGSSETLPQELSEIKKDKGEKWEELRIWCQQFYERGYRGSEDSLWKLTNKYCKKPTILKKLNDLQLPLTGVDDDWTKQAEKAKDAAKDETLKTNIKSATSTTPKKEDVLKQWCQDQYPKVHDSKLSDKNKTPIFEEVKKWCVVLIKDKIDNSNKMDLNVSEDTDGKWKEKAKSLHSHQISGNGGFALPNDLSSIKTTMNDSGNNWSQLKDWCKKAYDSPYKGATDTVWKSAEKFCKKA